MNSEDEYVRYTYKYQKITPTRFLSFSFILINLPLTYFAIKQRVPILKEEPEIISLDKDYQGLAIIMSFAVFYPASSYNLASVTPWPVFLLIPVVVLATAWSPTLSRYHFAVLGLFSIAMVFLELILLGRWGGVS